MQEVEMQEVLGIYGSIPAGFNPDLFLNNVKPIN